MTDEFLLFGRFGKSSAEVLRQIPTASHHVHLTEVNLKAGCSRLEFPNFALCLATTSGLRGKCDFGMGAFNLTPKVGDLAISIPGRPMTLSIDQPGIVRVCFISPILARKALRHLRMPSSDAYNFGQIHAQTFRSPVVEHMLERLWTLRNAACPVTRLIIESAVITIVSEVACVANAEKSSRQGGLAVWQVKKTCEIMLSNLANPISIAEMAASVGLSTYHFSRAFARSTGLPPQRWLQARRIERARELLETTGLSVGEIAVRVGYEDPSYFARIFRKHVGATPQQYRKMAG